jgi:hypothetical protein
MTSAFSARFDKALMLAAIIHEGVPRKGTVIPYITHPTHVARLLERHGFSDDMVLAGVLHDVLEDAEFADSDLQEKLAKTFTAFCGTEPSQQAFRAATETFIESELGAPILRLVQSVTERKTEGSQVRDWRTRKDEQVAHIRTFDRNSAALKAADALHNVQSVIREVRSQGLVPLRKFNCSIDETLWYYGAVADGVRDVLHDQPLHAEFDQAVMELTELVDTLMAKDIPSRCLFCGQPHDDAAECTTEKVASDFVVMGAHGRRIRSLAHWFHVAPPVGGVRQWVTGRSAREAARSWSGLRAPADVLALIRSAKDLHDFRPATVFAELVTPLDEFGEGRHHDLVVLGVAGNKRVLVGIEAKADEELGPRIGEYLTRVQAENDARRSQGKARLSRVPDRVDQLVQVVFGDRTPDVSSLRYQLLHGLAGTLIEARRRGADTAVFLVQEFLSDRVDDKKVRRNEEDFQAFAAAIGLPLDAGNEPMKGPFVAGSFESGGARIPCFVGLVTTRIGARESTHTRDAFRTPDITTWSREDAIRFGIQAYQDYTFMINDRPDRRLDDEQLLKDWRAAFPSATGKVFTGEFRERLDIIPGVRRDYNKGVENHGHRSQDGSVAGPPRHLSLPYRGGESYVYSERWLSGCERSRGKVRTR